ncbi:oxidoreductase [Paraburkholderia pallida]|uniref:Oxidoreductase n=1 Tax=Paraburkholderia pallida TaxID=2547399 RepID=A0A4P7D1D8_9BURK|nr:oxidoreductase [Paraburkholderia pallida]
MLKVVVTRRTEEAAGIVGLELRAADGERLPPFAPGAHIDVMLPNGLVRQYSLVNDCEERDRYEIAVSNVANGRGGSACVHSTLVVGTALEIGMPRNNFPLRSEHARFFFIAGGIGITPILSMIRYCNRHGLNWNLLYLARSRAHAAFLEELSEYGADRVRIHFDAEAGCNFDIGSCSGLIPAGVPIYCCGPAPLMQAVVDFSSRHPENPVFLEWFAPAPENADQPPAEGFEVVLKRSGKAFYVEEDRSILEVLESHGYNIPCSCREGMCRTCETGVVDGVPDHRDYVLSKAEREEGRTMMICVSRARNSTLVLDI